MSPDDSRYKSLLDFEHDHWHLIITSTGSSHNHQVWEGGYYDHLLQCFELATNLYNSMYKNLKLNLDSIFIVLFFHDIEKLWREIHGFDKFNFYTRTLPEVYKIKFTNEELNALQYIHGEGNDYSKDKRVMNELAAFCHVCDTLSARCFHQVKKLQW